MKGRWCAVAVVAWAAVGCGELLGVDGLMDRDVDANKPDACAPTHGVCSTFPQCGCRTNENCETTTIYGDTTCSSIGDTKLWNNCTGYGECSEGATCIGGVCKPFCNTAADCVGNNVTCEQIKVQSTGNPIPGLKVCSSGCDPMNPSAVCGPDVTCGPEPWDGLGHDHGDCFGPAGTAIGPDACVGSDTASSCAPGYYCTLAHACAHWCRVGHDITDCASSEKCVFFSTPPMISGNQYGVCVESGD